MTTAKTNLVRRIERDMLTGLSEFQLHERLYTIDHWIDGARGFYAYADDDVEFPDFLNPPALLGKLQAVIAERARRAADETLTMPLGKVRVGDVVTHVVTRGELIALDKPRMVIAALADVEAGARGVGLHSTTGVESVLYTEAVSAVRVTLRQRGYGSAEAATSAAVKMRGWTTRGGAYFRPVRGSIASEGYRRWEYTGIRGADDATARFTRHGHVVQVGGRWYVTGQTLDHLRSWMLRDAEQHMPLPLRESVRAAMECGDVTHREALPSDLGDDLVAHAALHLITKINGGGAS